jgi:hypothetical protein
VDQVADATARMIAGSNPRISSLARSNSATRMRSVVITERLGEITAL